MTYSNNEIKDVANINAQTMRIFWQHIQPKRWSFFGVSLGVALGVANDLYRPIWYKTLVNLLTHSPSYASLVHILWIILLLNFISWLLWRIATFADIYLLAGVLKNLSDSCFSYLHGHSYAFFADSFVGTLVRRVNRYTHSLEEMNDQWFWSIEPAIITVLVITVVLYFRSIWLGLAITVWTIFYLIFSFWYARYKFHFDTAAAKADSEVSGHLADTVTNNLNVKLFGGFASEYREYQKLSTALFGALQKAWNMEAFSNVVQSFFMIILEFTIFFVAIHLWERGALTIGDFVLLQVYVLQVFDHLWGVGKYIHRIYEALADSQEMTTVLMTPQEIQDVPGASQLKVLSGRINFQNVTFGYNHDKAVLDNFSLEVQARERIALIGPSGGGKSTIVKLLLRFMEVQEGDIAIDGQNIAQITQESLREQVALVPQDPLLFHRSLLENIRYARPEATVEEVVEAAKAAHCHEFITTFPRGYNTFVGERGVKLSGGERQRVALARAFLKNAPILILDEATSNLDSESERYIQEALHTLMRERTVIVIAHRLSTIKQMDRIYVLAKGQIQEEGTHKELLEINEGTYQRLWNIQVGGFAKAELS